jgi:hypothetical protein
MLIRGFPKFVGPNIIIISLRFLNPNILNSSPGSWQVETWYEVETPLNKLIARSALVPGANIVAATAIA